MELYLWLSWWNLSVSPETVHGDCTQLDHRLAWGWGWGADSKGVGVVQLLGGRGPGWSRNIPTVGPQRGVTLWMGTQGEGPQLAQECQVASETRLLAPRCNPLDSETPSEPPGEVRAGIGPGSVAAAGAYPRSFTSKGWVSPARPLPRGVSPTSPLPGGGEVLRRKDPRGLVPAGVPGKPREQPRRSAFPGNPSADALREGPRLRV